MLPDSFKPIFELLLMLGFRSASELMPRVWSDYDAEAGTICIPPAAAVQTTRGTISRMGKGKEPRYCRLPKRGIEILERLRKVVPLDQARRDRSKDFIFSGCLPRGGKLEDQARSVFRKAVAAAELPVDGPDRITLHSCRATFIRRCADAGIAPDTICSYSGHVPGSKMLSRYYGKVSVQAQKAVTDIFDQKPERRGGDLAVKAII